MWRRVHVCDWVCRGVPLCACARLCLPVCVCVCVRAFVSMCLSVSLCGTVRVSLCVCRQLSKKYLSGTIPSGIASNLKLRNL